VIPISLCMVRSAWNVVSIRPIHHDQWFSISVPRPLARCFQDKNDYKLNDTIQEVDVLLL
jgi:hypothetical protein